MKKQTIAGIKYLDLTEGIKWDKFIVSKEFSLLSGIFADEFFTSHVGITHRTVFQSDPFFFADRSIDDIPDEQMKEFAFLESAKDRKRVDFFCDALWFIKDNNVSAGEVYTYYFQIKDSEHRYINFRATTDVPTNSAGSYTSVTFTPQEIESGLDIMFKYNTQTQRPMKSPPAATDFSKLPDSGHIIIPASSSFVLHNEFYRIEKAMLALKLARTVSELQAKIALYVIAFECLFTTYKDEVTHRVSERIAFYMGADAAEKRNIYNDVKNAYSFRSSFAHGSNVSAGLNSREKYEEVSRKTDELLRRIMVKIITEDFDNFRKAEAPFNDFLLGLIFH